MRFSGWENPDMHMHISWSLFLTTPLCTWTVISILSHHCYYLANERDDGLVATVSQWCQTPSFFGKIQRSNPDISFKKEWAADCCSSKALCRISKYTWVLASMLSTKLFMPFGTMASPPGSSPPVPYIKAPPSFKSPLTPPCKFRVKRFNKLMRLLLKIGQNYCNVRIETF